MNLGLIIQRKVTVTSLGEVSDPESPGIITKENSRELEKGMDYAMQLKVAENKKPTSFH